MTCCRCKCKMIPEDIGIRIADIVLCNYCLNDVYTMTNMGYEEEFL